MLNRHLLSLFFLSLFFIQCTKKKAEQPQKPIRVLLSNNLVNNPHVSRWLRTLIHPTIESLNSTNWSCNAASSQLIIEWQDNDLSCKDLLDASKGSGLDSPICLNPQLLQLKTNGCGESDKKRIEGKLLLPPKYALYQKKNSLFIHQRDGLPDLSIQDTPIGNHLLELPTFKEWLQSSYSSNALSLSLEQPQGKSLSKAWNNLLSILTKSSPPKMLKLSNEFLSLELPPSSAKAEKKSGFEVLVPLLRHRENDALGAKVCQYLQGWIYSRLALSPKVTENAKKSVELQCSVNISPSSSQEISVAKLALPAVTASNRDFPIKDRADLLLPNPLKTIAAPTP